ncbi:MAG: EAL domain-containing protein [Burkholderiales bacterium]|nr:EAL domain-containing protein [Burkholderiales bacterium]
MNLKHFQWRSLQTRVTVLTLSLIVIAIGTVTFYVSRTLRGDMERLLGEQQFSTVIGVAHEIDSRLTDREQALQKIAKEITPKIMGDSAALQVLLEQRPLLQLLFNGGVFITRTDGTAIADVPVSAGRIGTNYIDRESVSTPLKEGRTVFGRPAMGKKLGAPIFSIVAPIFDHKGHVNGVIVGTINLGKPSFLDQIAQSRYGQSGGYLLIAPQHNLIVTASDKTRVMQPSPAPGLNAMHDRYMGGFEGFGTAVSSRGIEELSAAKGIPSAGWFIVATLPAKEAFAPISRMLQRLLVSTFVFTLVAAALTWWLISRLLRQQFAPIHAASRAIAVRTKSDHPIRALTVSRNDEIGELIGSFNRLLETLAQREDALKKSEQQLAITLNSIGDAVIATDTVGSITGMNREAERRTGWPVADALGRTLAEVFQIISADTRLPSVNPVQLVMERGEVVVQTTHTALLARDGSEYQIAASAAPIRDADDQIVGVVLVFSDVTERYRAQENLRLSEERYRFSLEVTGQIGWSCRPDGQLDDAPMWRQYSGQSLEEVAGWKWLDAIHPDDRESANQAVSIAVAQKCNYSTEYRLRRADGVYRNFLVRGILLFNADGSSKEWVGTCIDITERKQAEEMLAESVAELRRANENIKLAERAAKAGAYSWNFRTGESEWSDEFFRLFGLDPFNSKASYGTWQAALHPDDLKEAETQVADAIRERKPLIHEYRVVLSDGGVRWIAGHGDLIYDDSDEPCNLVGFCIDVTDRKQAEAKLKLAASVFDHAREGIVITDAHGTIVDVNATFTRITGYSHEDVIGQNPRILNSGRQNKAFYEAMWNAFAVQGHWSGEIWNRRKNGEVYAELLTISAVRDVHGVTQQYVGLFSDITALKEHQSQLEHIAHYDALTNLPNRLLLADRLQQAMAQAQRRNQQVAVAYLDLDGFKGINDRHGHDVGDQLLIDLATAMKDTLREGDTLARIGGDEFVAVLIDLDGVESCVPMLTRLLAAACAPVQFGEVVLQGSASIGVTFFPQSQDMEADQLLRQADQAMYQAKLAGKNRYHVFDADHDSSVRIHHESLERIRLALVRGEFVLHYQPKVNMRSGQVIGAEALIRWQHPEKGLLAPATFLPLIEDHPLAVEVGEWVIDMALAQIEAWHRMGLELPVSVNVGARQLQQGNFMARLQAILALHPQVSPVCLGLEVLETSALADMAQVSQVIEACAQIGVKFALDDFGTGYSSLTYLKRLRVALLKIDQSFVRDMLVDPDDLAILEGVIGLAAAFKREVIAEGVETVEHGTALLHLGCQLAQGYGIARPMPADQLPAWVASWQPDDAWSELPRQIL